MVYEQLLLVIFTNLHCKLSNAPLYVIPNLLHHIFVMQLTMTIAKVGS